MSMYSDLLGGACTDLEAVRLPPSRTELVVILLQRRRRAQPPEQRRDLAEDLAVELDHDRMLLRLCHASGIEAGTALFANPLPERRRLECLLGQAGIELWTLDDNRRVAGP